MKAWFRLHNGPGFFNCSNQEKKNTCSKSPVLFGPQQESWQKKQVLYEKEFFVKITKQQCTKEQFFKTKLIKTMFAEYFESTRCDSLYLQ